MSLPSLPDTPALPRILLVDDNADMLEALQALLEALGFAVAVAHDAPSALARVAGFAAQVAVVDIGLPGTDGVALAPRLREAAGSPLRLVAFTGYGGQEDVARTRQAGFDAHLVKPVEIDRLIAALTG